MQTSDSSSKSWGLAAGGPLAHWHLESFTVLQSRYSPVKCRQILAEWWSVRDRKQTFAMRDWLVSSGHTQVALQLVDSEVAKHSTGNVDGQLGYALKHRDKILRAGLRAWDLGRLISVARWALTGGFLTPNETWEWILDAGMLLRLGYDSWEEYGDGWLLGYEFWDGGKPADPGFAKQLQWLRHDSSSPWKKIPWHIAS
jgi:Protein of unknown function (DUF1266)